MKIMKLTSILKTLATVCAVALTQIGSQAQAKETIPGVAEQPAAYFYTGKPYDSDLGNYTFNARNYNPEINRWTSADPSGFPDGANNSVYAPVATSQLDANGLWKIRLEGQSNYTAPNVADNKSYSGSLGASAYFEGGTGANCTDTSGSVTSAWYGSGIAHVLDPRDFILKNPSISISIDSNGLLTYSAGSSNFEGTVDSVGLSIRYQISGESTKSLNVHVTIGTALKASTVSGGGASGSGGSISFAGTSYSDVFASGDFHFTAVE